MFQQGMVNTSLPLFLGTISSAICCTYGMCSIYQEASTQEFTDCDTDIGNWSRSCIIAQERFVRRSIKQLEFTFLSAENSFIHCHLRKSKYFQLKQDGWLVESTPALGCPGHPTILHQTNALWSHVIMDPPGTPSLGFSCMCEGSVCVSRGVNLCGEGSAKRGGLA